MGIIDIIKKHPITLSLFFGTLACVIAISILNYLEISFFPGLYSALRSVFELLYFLSGIILIIGLYIGYQQLNLAKVSATEQMNFAKVAATDQMNSAQEHLSSLKDDIKIRNERLAVEKSMDYLELFANSLIPQIDTYRQEIDDRILTILSWDPKANDYSLSQEVIDLLPPREHLRIMEGFVDRQRTGLVPILNRLEFFSAAITHGLAKEDVVYVPISRIYCKFIEDEMLFLCSQRYLGNPYENVIKLYNQWKLKREADLHRLQIQGYASKIELTKKLIASSEKEIIPHKIIGEQ